MTDTELQREALRQQMLLGALLGGAHPDALAGWLREAPAQQRRGLQAYRANAGALAERALAAAFPTVQHLLGDESFAALARALWQAHPPLHGDVAIWGDALPGFIATSDQLAPEPYLADVARLDWAVHQADRAADDNAPPQGLALLAQGEVASTGLRLRAGHAVLASEHPLHTLWMAHHADAAADDDRFAAVRQAFAEGRAEAVRVRREGLRSVVDRIDAPTAAFEAQLLQGAPLGDAAAAAGEAFDFEPWLVHTLQRNGLAAVQPAGAAWAIVKPDPEPHR